MCVENSTAARNTIVLSHLGLVRTVAARFMGRGTDFEDLVQIGTLGLIRAAERFDPAYGTQFSTYAVPQIMGELKQYFRDGGVIKVSRSYQKVLADIAAFTAEFQNTHGKSPAISDICAELQMEKEKVSEIICASKSVLSFSAPLPDGEGTLADTLSAPEPFSEHTQRFDLHRAIESLLPREKKLIFLRYMQEKSQREIGELLGISQVQVSRLEKKTLQKLRELA